ncbi:MAG TPA: Gfo/Idh/MocA family oxidoreductase [Nitrospiraceae bacterium]|nr:Gfo/Idh/MocA family oxidoreductase [Nitrospiraceae bacterium]
MRIGIVGCGEIAPTHARFIAEQKQGRLVGVCDMDGHKARTFAESFGVERSYQDLDMLLEEQKPDVVHVLTPPQSHAAVAIAAMEAGCHVLVEKPMAVSSEEADAMIRVSRTQGVKLCVNHNQLFEPIMLEALRLLRDGALGEIISVESQYGLNFVSDPERPWVEALPGGIFQNLAPHPLYLSLEFLGDPVELHASTLSTGVLDSNSPDELRIVMKGERVIGQVALSLGIRPNVNFLRISGTGATVHVDFAGRTLRVERLRALPKAVARALFNLELAGQLTVATFSNALKLVTRRLKPYQGHGNLIRAFYRSIADHSPAPVSVEAARRVVGVYDLVRTELFAVPE